MRLCKVRRPDASEGVGVLDGDRVRLLRTGDTRGPRTFSEILHSGDPAGLARSLAEGGPEVALAEIALLAPIDNQEVWAAGVTYKRSREAREQESVGAARFYNLVYDAPRPELFFKATPRRVTSPGQPIRARKDSRWSVPEPEVALVVSPDLRLVGYSIGNDVSARDIEGENPLYLPQAKVYRGACALGPCVTLAGSLPPPDQTTIRLTIARGGTTAFDGSTTLAAMHRPFADLIDWLGRENDFPDGVVLLTGTGVVPPDDFTLKPGDVVSIDVAGIGKLTNPVVE